MTEFIERMSLDDLDFGDESRSGASSPFTPAKLMGVAFLGAAVALSGYYIYSSLGSEERARLRDGVLNFVSDQVKGGATPFTAQQAVEAGSAT
ncbi:MAG: hypothetical protein K6A35_09745 [bacterium]|nr:hypothetical protein [bacterium]